MKHALLSVLVVVGVAGVPLFAHHSFAATYFEDKTITVEGELVEFEYRAPGCASWRGTPTARWFDSPANGPIRRASASRASGLTR